MYMYSTSMIIHCTYTIMYIVHTKSLVDLNTPFSSLLYTVSGSPHSRQTSQWLYSTLIQHWLLISARSSHFLSLLSVQPTPSVRFSHSNILPNDYKILEFGDPPTGTLIVPHTHTH